MINIKFRISFNLWVGNAICEMLRAGLKVVNILFLCCVLYIYTKISYIIYKILTYIINSPKCYKMLYMLLLLLQLKCIRIFKNITV